MLVFVGGCVASFVLELLACIFKGIFSILASRLWLLTVILFALFFIVVVIKQLCDDYREKKYLIPCIFALIIAFFAFQIGNFGFSDLSYESTEEVTAGLRALEQTDWNYTGVGFTGYPIKQYIVNAIPTVILGRKFISLNLGFALPFLMGLTLLFIEMRHLTAKLGIDEKFSLLPVFFISFCPFIDDYYYIFEQSITPVSYTMIIIALFFRCMRKRSLLSFAMLTITACMLPYLYTPALAFMGLYIVIMIYHAINVIASRSGYIEQEKTDKNYLVSVFAAAAMPVLFFVCTLVSKRHDRFLTSYGESFSAEKQSEYLKSFFRFFIDNDSLFWGIFGAIVLVYLIASITFRLKFHDLLISLWCIATMLFSFVLPGVAIVYNFYYKPMVLAQRGLIMVPVLAVSMLIAVSGFIRNHKISMRKDCLAIISAAFLLFGANSLFSVHTGFEYNNNIQHMKYMIKYVQESMEFHGTKYDDEFVIIIHSENALLDNAWEFTQYFFPKAKVYVFRTEQHGGIGINDAIFEKYVVTESDKTAGYYNMQFKSRTFRNSRYDEDTLLYFTHLDRDYSYVDQYDQAYIDKYNLQQYKHN